MKNKSLSSGILLLFLCLWLIINISVSLNFSNIISNEIPDSFYTFTFYLRIINVYKTSCLFCNKLTFSLKWDKLLRSKYAEKSQSVHMEFKEAIQFCPSFSLNLCLQSTICYPFSSLIDWLVIFVLKWTSTSSTILPCSLMLLFDLQLIYISCIWNFPFFLLNFGLSISILLSLMYLFLGWK